MNEHIHMAKKNEGKVAELNVVVTGFTKLDLD